MTLSAKSFVGTAWVELAGSAFPTFPLMQIPMAGIMNALLSLTPSKAKLNQCQSWVTFSHSSLSQGESQWCWHNVLLRAVSISINDSIDLGADLGRRISCCKHSNEGRGRWIREGCCVYQGKIRTRRFSLVFCKKMDLSKQFPLSTICPFWNQQGFHHHLHWLCCSSPLENTRTNRNTLLCSWHFLFVSQMFLTHRKTSSSRKTKTGAFDSPGKLGPATTALLMVGRGFQHNFWCCSELWHILVVTGHKPCSRPDLITLTVTVHLL